MTLLLMIGSVSTFALQFRATSSASRRWFIGACLLAAGMSLVSMRASPELMYLFEPLGSLGVFVVLGFILISRLDASMVNRVDVDLERLMFALLAPAVARFVFLVVIQRIVIISHSTGLIWPATLASAAADVIAIGALIRLVHRSANPEAT